MAVAPDAAGFDGLAENQARIRANNVLGFLPSDESVCVEDQDAEDTCHLICSSNTATGTRQCIFEVNYEFGNWGFLVTGLLPLPDNIRGVGVVNTQLPAT